MRVPPRPRHLATQRLGVVERAAEVGVDWAELGLVATEGGDLRNGLGWVELDDPPRECVWVGRQRRERLREQPAGGPVGTAEPGGPAEADKVRQVGVEAHVAALRGEP